ncbi:MAG TPA: LysM peptidoglycan-binding domain-containing protein [Streptosporangiaceae bacterium]|nr:LysM peptidoglycan-binding domain-containing protein [Streptosporangiaceae bacterium]
MSALSAMEAAVVDGAAPASAGRPGLQPGQRRLRLVRQSGPDDKSRAAIPGTEPRFSSIPVSARTPLTDLVLTPSAVISPRPRPVAAQSPVRLTRRGRAVVVALVVAAIVAVALVIAMATAAGARAASPGQPGSGHRGMHEIVVQQGQTLWSIASAAEPTADPRVVVAQIMAANRMTTADLAAGQLLWVPR